MKKSKRQVVRQRRAMVACVGVLTAATVFAFATINSRVKQFEAAVDASRAEPMKAVAVAEPAPTPAPLYDVPLDADLQMYIIEQCEKREVDPAVVFAMIERESQYTADAVGDNGNSFGLMQIQPKWHYNRMVELGCTNLLDPYDNVTVGIDLLDDLLDKYEGDYGKALTVYNSGSYKGKVSSYAMAVLDIAEEIKGDVNL